MRNGWRLRGLTVLMIAALAAGLAGCGGGQSSTSGQGSGQFPWVVGDHVKFGAYLPNTGSFSTFGESSQRGMSIAVEEINTAGGVLGKQIDLIVEDTQGKPDGSASAVQKLISQDNACLILGEVASSDSLAAAPICQSQGVPMITPSSTNPKVTAVGDYIFRVCFIDPFQGKVMAKFAVNTLKAKSAAILIDQTSDYAKGLGKYFQDTFTQMGGTIVASESYFQNDSDFRGQLEKIKEANPDVIFIPGYYREAGMIAQQARPGITVPLLGGDGWDSPKLTEIGGKALNNSFFSNHYSVEAKTPAIQKYVAAYQAKYGVVPDSLSALAYDSVKVAADAITRAGSFDRKAIRDALAATKNYPGLTGSITINANRDADKSAVVLEVKDGKLLYRETVNP